jgi:hypothetical protein
MLGSDVAVEDLAGTVGGAWVAGGRSEAAAGCVRAGISVACPQAASNTTARLRFNQ